MEFFRSTVVSFLVLLFLTVTTQTEDSALETPVFIPSNYYLHFYTDQAALTYKDNYYYISFTGYVDITGKIIKPKGFDANFNITLDTPKNMRGFQYGFEKKRNNEKNIEFARYVNWEDRKVIIEFLREDLDYDEYRIKMTYKTVFEQDNLGFYRSSYVDANGTTRWLLTTQFAPSLARDAFPCFDKPNLKATFEVRVDIHKRVQGRYHVLSNTPCQKLKSNSFEHYLYECKKTPNPIPPHLLAVTISNFEGTEPLEFESDFNTENAKCPKVRQIRTFGNPALIKTEAELSQRAAQQALTKMTKYLGVGYAFEKLDQVAIPDLQYGATEQWGLVSYREKTLFFNNKTGTTSAKQNNVLTITGEMVRQWFGNLVTPESWDYIWLTESFATYLQYLIASQFENPNTSTWGYKEQMLVDEIHSRAFETDGYPTSKELSSQVTDDSLYLSLFNDITSSKGAAVLRMWDLSMENDKFKSSLKEYVLDRKTDAANPSHLYNAFNKQANMNKNFFASWTEEAGYPVVEVTKKNGGYVLTQSRFLWQRPNIPENAKWMVPISYTTEDKRDWSTKPDIWLYEKPEKIETSSKWIIVNNQQAGYYRVNYDTENWMALSQILKENYSMIHELNRAQIVNDVFSLARSYQKKYIDYSTALELSKYLNKETSFVVLKTALNSFDYMMIQLISDSLFTPLSNHVLEIIKPQFKGLKVSGLAHMETLKAVEMARYACYLNYEPCVKEAKSLYKTSSLYPETREIILCTAIKNDDKVFEEVFAMYEKESNSATKVMYLSVLGCTGNKALVKNLLNMTLSETSKVRRQDLMYILSSVYNNPSNTELALSFIEQNFIAIANRYTSVNPLGTAILNIARKLNRVQDLKRMKILAESISMTPEGKLPASDIATALTVIQNNINWIHDKKPEIAKYFEVKSASSLF